MRLMMARGMMGGLMMACRTMAGGRRMAARKMAGRMRANRTLTRRRGRRPSSRDHAGEGKSARLMKNYDCREHSEKPIQRA